MKKKRVIKDSSSSREEERERQKEKEKEKEKEIRKDKQKLPTLTLRKKISSIKPTPVQNTEQIIQQHNKPNKIKVIIQPININKIFQQILNHANRQPEYLINLKNLLSGCSKTLTDKKEYYKKKRDRLNSSNCGQQEYFKKKNEIENSEKEEIKQIQQDAMTKLGYSNIRGFQTKELLIQNFKNIYFGTKSQKINQSTLFQVDQEQFQKHKNQQMQLLQKLMKQHQLVSLQHMNSKLIRSSSNSQNIDKGKYQFNRYNMQSQQVTPLVKFEFSKQFNCVNYDQIFKDTNKIINLQEKDIYKMSKTAKTWLLDFKSDQVYSSQKFQQKKYQKYSAMLKNIMQVCQNMQQINPDKVEQLLQVATYVLNSVHYYQKFKLKCQLLHPMDVVYVIDKLRQFQK